MPFSQPCARANLGIRQAPTSIREAHAYGPRSPTTRSKNTRAWLYVRVAAVLRQKATQESRVHAKICRRIRSLAFRVRHWHEDVSEIKDLEHVGNVFRYRFEAEPPMPVGCCNLIAEELADRPRIDERKLSNIYEQQIRRVHKGLIKRFA
jgi:hypothetical protein